LDFGGNDPSLSTSVLNSHSAKVFSVKNNQFLQFNSQTAQRRDLENVFNTNALAYFEPDTSYQGPRTYPLVYNLFGSF